MLLAQALIPIHGGMSWCVEVSATAAMIRLTLKLALASSFLFVRVVVAAHLAGNEKSRSVMEEFLWSSS